MKRLEIEFSRTLDGEKYIHTQVQRKDFEDGRCVCIYKVVRERDKQLDAYEVFIPRLQKKDIKMPTAGYVSPAGEKYPGNNDFGPRADFIAAVRDPKDAWQRAQQSFNEYEQRILETIEATRKKTEKKLSKPAVVKKKEVVAVKKQTKSKK